MFGKTISRNYTDNSMKKIILCLLLLLCFSEAQAKVMSGKMALAFCSDNVQCALIASAYSDGFSYALLAIQADNSVFCMPAGVSSGLLGRIFRRYLSSNPDQLHFTAASLAVTAFSEEFPCEHK
tara:strand:+ start:655 stop:1026 length:372 start_codon:yes stop_codon:yes gene_type:complete